MKILTVRQHKSGKGNPYGVIRCSRRLIGKKVAIRILNDKEIKELASKQEISLQNRIMGIIGLIGGIGCYCWLIWAVMNLK